MRAGKDAGADVPLDGLSETRITRIPTARKSLSTLRMVVPFIVGAGMLMVLAAVPDAVRMDDADLIAVKPAAVVEDISSYIRGVFTGDAWTYGNAWYRRDFFENMPPRFLRSLRYLLTSALLATTLGLIVGAWLTATRRDRLKDVVTFAGAMPDFILALLLQIAVVAVYRSTGFRIARVASITNEDAAVLLPLISLTLIPAVYLIRTISARAYVIASEDFVLVSKATGLSRSRIWLAQIAPNLTAFLRADLAKVCGMMLANFFIVEYLFNVKGVTTLLFSFGPTSPYDYNLVMNSFLAMILLYVIIYLALRIFVRAIDTVARRV